MSMTILATGTAPQTKSRTCSGLDSLILAATDDMRYLTCTTTESETSNSTTKTTPRRKLRSWNESFNVLVAYADIHGTTAVPVRYKEDTALANWVRYQQRNYDALSSDKRQKLESIGFQFGARNDRQWNIKFMLYQEHIRRQGAEIILRDAELSQWVSTQRSLYKKNLMRQDRRSKLESIGFVWQSTSTTTTGSNRSSSKKSVGNGPELS